MHRMLHPLRDALDGFRMAPARRERRMYRAYGPEFREWCREHRCPVLKKPRELYQFVFDTEWIDGPIDYLEFGVYKGTTLRWWLAANRHPGSTFVGFDSFEGLPEDWGQIPKGTFSANGMMPEIDDACCTLVKGLFHETLPDWIAGRQFARRTVVHLDADLYSSTLLVLMYLLPKLMATDVMILDDFSSYLDGYKAFREATRCFETQFAVLGRTTNWGQVAVRLLAPLTR
jgi:hypothetical protein